MSEVREVEVSTPHPLLSESDWADAYQVRVARRFRSAREAAEACIDAFPTWYRPLLGLREVVVAPFGLKHASDVTSEMDVIGIFPVTSETLERLVAGIDDKHLDFRIVVDLDPADDDAQFVTLTTVIKRHNMIGKGYLAMVTPFHRVLIKTALRQLAKSRQ
ncbi:MAG: DUF2867 domain-containing protein [Pseudomonadota bacterium]